MSNKIAIGIQLLRDELCLIELLKADVATIKENIEVMQNFIVFFDAIFAGSPGFSSRITSQIQYHHAGICTCN